MNKIGAIRGNNTESKQLAACHLWSHSMTTGVGIIRGKIGLLKNAAGVMVEK
jgi:hypothetical protein